MQYIYISGVSTSGRFLVNLPKTIILNTATDLGILDIKFENKTTSSIYVLCNICSESIYNDNILPIIRRVDNKLNIYSHPIFHKIVIKEINSFYLYFKKTDWTDVNESFAITLCLRQM